MLLKEFTKPECDYFISECNFTEEEEAVFKLKVKGKTTTEILFALRDTPYAMSTSTIERRLRSIRNKIIKVL